MASNVELSSASGNPAVGGQKPCCPFFIYDDKQYHHCGTLQFRYLSDVRHHCERNHVQMPLFCPTCKVTFYGNSRRSQLDAHIVQNSCALRHREPLIMPPGLELNGLSTYGNSQLEKKWYFMWDQLFPMHPRPSSIYCRNLSAAEQVSRAVVSFINSPKPQELILEVFGENFAPSRLAVNDEEIIEFTRRLLLEFSSDFHRAQGYNN